MATLLAGQDFSLTTEPHTVYKIHACQVIVVFRLCYIHFCNKLNNFIREEHKEMVPTELMEHNIDTRS